MPRLDAFGEYSCRVLAQVLGVDPDEMLAYVRDEKPIPGGFAAFLETHSQGLVPLAYWKRVHHEWQLPAKPAKHPRPMQQTPEAKNASRRGRKMHDASSRPLGSRFRDPSSKLHGLSYQKLAKVCGVSWQSLQSYDTGRRGPPSHLEAMFEREYGIPRSDWPKARKP